MTFPSAAKSETIGRIERLDPELDQLVGAMPDRSAGFGFHLDREPSRGLVTPKRGICCFRISHATASFVGHRTPESNCFMSPSGYTGVTYYGLEPGSNGLTLDKEGRLVACEHGDRRVSC